MDRRATVRLGLRRGAALLVDVAIAFTPILVGAVWSGLQGLAAVYHGPHTDPSPLLVAVPGAWALGCMALRDVRPLRASAGKRWLGLRVEVLRPGAWRMPLRNLITLVVVLVPILLVVEAVLSLVGDGRRLADRLAGTRVESSETSRSTES